MSATLKDVRIRSFDPLVSPEALSQKIPLTENARMAISQGRDALRKALAGDDNRLVVIVGPCSIHDGHAALEYASRLEKVAADVSDQILVVMRVYFEKPRTTVGWKGLISDPHLDGTGDVATGLARAREILLAIAEMGLPTATEFLDPITPQYTADLVCWAAIGARTTESQTHRQMASGLSMPVGFKNATGGSLQVALDAMVSARAEHSFLGIDNSGMTCIVNTAGNPDVHLVLRGGSKPNYSPADIAFARVSLGSPAGRREIMIDCSHGNSNKDYTKQPKVFFEILDQVRKGEKAILGMMLESNLVEGRQDIDKKELTYGQSVTDGCISWETTDRLLREAHAQLQDHARQALGPEGRTTDGA